MSLAIVPFGIEHLLKESPLANLKDYYTTYFPKGKMGIYSDGRTG
jgi:hypothetical protein